MVKLRKIEDGYEVIYGNVNHIMDEHENHCITCYACKNKLLILELYFFIPKLNKEESICNFKQFLDCICPHCLSIYISQQNEGESNNINNKHVGRKNFENSLKKIFPSQEIKIVWD